MPLTDGQGLRPENYKQAPAHSKKSEAASSKRQPQIINKPPGEVWRGSALPLHFQSILAACTAKSRVFTKRSD